MVARKRQTHPCPPFCGIGVLDTYYAETSPRFTDPGGVKESADDTSMKGPSVSRHTSSERARAGLEAGPERTGSGEECRSAPHAPSVTDVFDHASIRVRQRDALTVRLDDGRIPFRRTMPQAHQVSSRVCAHREDVVTRSASSGLRLCIIDAPRRRGLSRRLCAALIGAPSGPSGPGASAHGSPLRPAPSATTATPRG